MADIAPNDDAKNVITIAVDFGTTFSGCAWHWSGNVRLPASQP